MRSVLDKVDEEKIRRRNNLIIGIVLVAIMVFSTLGYAFYSADRTEESSAESIKYNGIDFKKTNYGSWIFEISGYGFETKYNPQETENISVILTKNIQDYNGQAVYFGIDSKENISQAGNNEILNNVNQFIFRSNFACLTESCTEDYPIKNCSDNNLIIFKTIKEESKESTRIKDEEKCVFIYSSEEDIERSADAFLFRIFGIQQ